MALCGTGRRGAPRARPVRGTDGAQFTADRGPLQDGPAAPRIPTEGRREFSAVRRANPGSPPVHLGARADGRRRLQYGGPPIARRGHNAGIPPPFDIAQSANGRMRRYVRRWSARPCRLPRSGLPVHRSHTAPCRRRARPCAPRQKRSRPCPARCPEAGHADRAARARGVGAKKLERKRRQPPQRRARSGAAGDDLRGAGQRQCRTAHLRPQREASGEGAAPGKDGADAARPANRRTSGR